MTISSGAVLWCRRNLDSFWLPFIVLLALHQVYYGALLIGSNFIPYVMDGNETFSVWWHAHNLYTFSFWKSFGLTDESYGLTEASHPFFHTHQGNMPRLFGFLIYALGARTVEAQVLVTTLIIGNLTLFFCYASIAKVTRPVIAFVFCLFLFSDYLLFSQWHVVTYRVWYGFLFFGSLFAISSADRSDGRKWPYVLQAGLFFLLFYFELVFAVYLSIIAGFYILWMHRNSFRRIAALYAVQLVAGLSAIGLLLLQNVLTFGFEVVKADFATTFFARNASSAGTTFAAVEEFFRNHNIVFWNNFRDSTQLRTLGAFVQSIGTNIFQIWTPPFFILVGVPFLGVLISFLESHLRSRPRSMQSRSVRFFGLRVVDPQGGSLAYSVNLAHDRNPAFQTSSRFAELRLEGPGSSDRSIALKVPALLTREIFWRRLGYICVAALAVRAITAPGALVGLEPDRAVSVLWAGLLCLSVFISCGLLVVGYLTARPQLMTVGRAFLCLSLCAGLIINSYGMFNQAYSGTWITLFESGKVRGALRAAVIVALAAATGIAAVGATGSFGVASRAGIRAAIIFMLFSFAGYAGVYLLSPGYVLSGYAERYAPFAIYFLSMLPALAIYAVVVAGGRFSRLIAFRYPNVMPWGRIAVPAVMVCFVAVPVVLWIAVQLYYVRLFPPDHVAFLKILRTPPFHHATFAVNNYAAPAAYYSRNWAYFDTVIGYGGFDRDGTNYTRLTDRSMVWLADWKSSSEYARPAFYLCIPGRTFASILFERDPSRQELPFRFCKDAPILKQKLPFTHPMMASDTVPPRFWSIVSLDWHGPTINAVDTAVDFAGGEWTVSNLLDLQADPKYPVTSSRFELLAGAPEKGCEATEEDLKVIQQSDANSRFVLPAGFRGPFRIRAQARSDGGDSEPTSGHLWTVRSTASQLAGSASRCPIVVVDTSFGLDSTLLREKGWASPETWGTWTEGPQASLHPISIPNVAGNSDFMLEADIRAFIPKLGRNQEVSVFANGVVVARWVLTDTAPEQLMTARIPKAVFAKSSSLSLSFAILHPLSPASFGLSPDTRHLGIGLKHLKIREIEKQ
jgi:hypothetical protein